MRIAVDFPAPLLPSRPKTSPSSTPKPRPSTAVKGPKRLTRLSTSITRAIVPPASAPHRAVEVGAGLPQLGGGAGARQARLEEARLGVQQVGGRDEPLAVAVLRDPHVLAGGLEFAL